MSPAEEAAFRAVAERCQADVQRLCPPKVYHEIWIALPPPSLEEMEAFLDHMFQSVLVGPLVETSTPADFSHVVHHLLANIAVQTPPEKVPCTAQRIASHGSLLLEQHAATDTLAHHVARRLSEVTEEDLAEHHHQVDHQPNHYHLPFAPAQAACLRQATGLSEPCTDALQQLEQARQPHPHYSWYRIFVQVSLLVWILHVFCFRQPRPTDLPPDVRTARRVLLRDAVELVVYNDYGNILTWGPFVCTLMAVALLLGLYVDSVHDNSWKALAAMVTWPLFTAFMLYTMVQFGFRALVPPDMCQCCCCGATVRGALWGTLTDDQAGCECCQGTGVSCLCCAEDVKCGDCSCCDQLQCCCCGDACGCCTSSSKKGDNLKCCCCGDACGCCSSMQQADNLKCCCCGCGCCASEKEGDNLKCCCCCCCCADGSCCCSSTKKGDRLKCCGEGCSCSCSCCKAMKEGNTLTCCGEGCSCSCSCCKAMKEGKNLQCCANGCCCCCDCCNSQKDGETKVGADGCCCCGEGCSCCSGDKKRKATIVVYEGVPVTIV